MNRAAGLSIRLDKGSESPPPGGWVRGVVELKATTKTVTGVLEVALIWKTIGKSANDCRIGCFQTLVPNRAVEPGQQYRFSLPAPTLPRTMDTKHFAIRWFVRARLRPAQGEPFFGSHLLAIR
ncbi:MAG: hypothetical protein HY814_15200 [Candidatus Riflebacteria bacterium]|nr:hypothetical protein [Candidatus Riflebacteria bacterium]